MTIETHQDLIGLQRIGQLVGQTLHLMKQHACVGITTAEIDAIAAAYLAQHGARSAPPITYGYPAATCISVNEEAVHGIPGARVLQAGDLVTVDVSAELDGYFADAAVSFVLPPITPLKRRLVQCARAAFERAWAVAQAGRPINVIGRAVEQEVKRHGFSVMAELSGHGLGRGLHEPPDIPNVYLRRHTTPLANGLVITIEPIVAAGKGRSITDADGWTVRPQDGSLSAHYEHTIVITPTRPLILTPNPKD